MRWRHYVGRSEKKKDTEHRPSGTADPYIDTGMPFDYSDTGMPYRYNHAKKYHMMIPTRKCHTNMSYDYSDTGILYDNGDI